MRPWRRIHSAVAVVTVVAVAACAGFAVTTVTGDGHDDDGGTDRSAASGRSEANLWVVPGAGTCTRSATVVAYADAAARDARCGSLDQAYDAASQSPADTLALMRGTFPYDGDEVNQAITGDRDHGGHITFECAAGQQCVFEGIVQFGDGLQVGGSFPGGPDDITLRHARTSTFAEAVGAGRYQHDDNRFGAYLLGGTSHVRLEHVQQGGFLMQGVRDVRWTGGESGPCMAPALAAFNPAPIKDNPCELNKMDFACAGAPRRCQTRDVVIDRLSVFGFAYDDNCVQQAASGPDGCHHRNWYMNGVKDVTIRNSTFRESVFEPWATISGADAGRTGNEGILWENNQFGASVVGGPHDVASTPTTGLGGGATCWAGRQPSYRDITIRFNSFAADNGLAVPGNIPPAEDDATDELCTVTGYLVYGNIFGTAPAGEEGCGNDGGAIEYRYNLYAGDVAATCDGAAEQYIGGTGMPFYAKAGPAPKPADYALAGPSMAADDLVPADDPAFPCPATDARGITRPSGPGTSCDAGAFER
jgi:hypothetical protein